MPFLFRLIGCALFLVATACHAAVKPESVVYYPAGVTKPVPVAVWLHGYRGFPGALSDKEYFQATADKLKIAIIGIPGTTVLTDDTLVWSEEPAADHHYIQEVLSRLAAKQPLDLKRVALFGFSQGAMVAADISSRYPEAYLGAIVMSPGGITDPKDPAKGTDLHKRQTYYVICGAGEAKGTVELTRYYASVLKELGGSTTKKEYEGMSEHTRPPDFKNRFPEWISQILHLEGQTQ